MASENVDDITVSVGHISVDHTELFTFAHVGYFPQFTTRVEAMRRDQALTDVFLKSGSTTMSCHRSILSGASSYFYNLFMNQQVTGTVHLSDISPDVLPQVVDYLYTGCITIQAQHIRELSIASFRLQLDDLTNACDSFMANKVCPSNALGLHTLASMYHLHKTLAATKECMLQKPTEITTQALDQEFKAINKTLFLQWITNPQLRVPNEDTKFSLAEKWLGADHSHQNKTCAKQILEVIKLTECSLVFLMNNVSNSQFAKYKACKKMILRAKDQILMMFAQGGATPRSAPAASTQHQTPQTTSPRPAQQASCHDQRKQEPKLVLIGGGFYNDKVWILDNMQQGSWKHLTTLPKQHKSYTYSLGACAVNTDSIVVTGGGPSYLTNQAWMFKMSTGSWRALQPMGHKRWFHGCVAHNEDAYVIGGSDGSRDLVSVDKWDSSTGQWSTLSMMPHPMGHCHAFVIRGDIYVVSTSQKKTLRYNVAQNKWRVLADRPDGVSSYASVACMNENIYIVGGKAGAKCVSYNISLNQWTQLTSHKEDHVAGVAVAYGGHILLCGGEFTDVVERYDTNTDTWQLANIKLPAQLQQFCFVQL